MSIPSFSLRLLLPNSSFIQNVTIFFLLSKQAIEMLVLEFKLILNEVRQRAQRTIARRSCDIK